MEWLSTDVVTDERVKGWLREETEWLHRFTSLTADQPGSLLTGLRDMVAEKESTGLRVHVTWPADEPDVRPDRVHAVAVREALTNVRKHAGTTEAWLSVDTGDGEVAVAVTDRGAGFDPEHTPVSEGTRLSIRQRVTDVGGRVRTDSVPGCGTTDGDQRGSAAHGVRGGRDHPRRRTGHGRHRVPLCAATVRAPVRGGRAARRACRGVRGRGRALATDPHGHCGRLPIDVPAGLAALLLGAWLSPTAPQGWAFFTLPYTIFLTITLGMATRKAAVAVLLGLIWAAGYTVAVTVFHHVEPWHTLTAWPSYAGNALIGWAVVRLRQRANASLELACAGSAGGSP